MVIYGNQIGSPTKEKDPTISAWAKEESKPSYEISEFGLKTEDWTFTLNDGTSVTKQVITA